MTRKLRIGTRGSQPALWQAQHVAERIRRLRPEVQPELVVIRTKGDRLVHLPPLAAEGKGLFTGSRYARFFHEMLDKGFYFAPSQFEVAFMSTAHTDELIRDTLEAADQVFASLAREAAE